MKTNFNKETIHRFMEFYRKDKDGKELIGAKAAEFLESLIYNKIFFSGFLKDFNKFVGEKYINNVSTIAHNAKNDILSLIDLKYREEGSKIIFVKRSREYCGSIDLDRGLYNFFAEKNLNLSYPLKGTITNFFADSFDGITECKLYMLNTYSNCTLVENIEELIEKLVQNVVDIYINKTKKFDIIQNMEIDFETMALRNGSSKPKKKLTMEKVEKKFIDENFYTLDDESKEIIEYYNNNPGTLISTITTKGLELQDINTKKEFCKNYGFNSTTINSKDVLYFSRDNIEYIQNNIGFNAAHIKMADSLAYPVNTVEGVTAGFILRKNLEKEENEKYKIKHNSVRNFAKEKDNKFKKGLLVWNLDKVKKAVENEQKIETLIIFESIAKALVVQQNLNKEIRKNTFVLAIMGKDLTNTQIALINSVVTKETRIIMALDNDEPGENANIKGMLQFIKAGYTNVHKMNKNKYYNINGEKFKDENDLLVKLIDLKKNEVFGNLTFATLLKKMLKDTIDSNEVLPTIKQLDVLTNANYSIGDITNVLTGINLDIKNETVQRCANVVVKENKFNTNNIEELNDIFKQGGTRAVQILIAILSKNNGKRINLVQELKEEVKEVKEVKEVEEKVENETKEVSTTTTTTTPEVKKENVIILKDKILEKAYTRYITDTDVNYTRISYFSKNKITEKDIINFVESKYFNINNCNVNAIKCLFQTINDYNYDIINLKVALAKNIDVDCIEKAKTMLKTRCKESAIDMLLTVAKELIYTGEINLENKALDELINSLKIDEKILLDFNINAKMFLKIELTEQEGANAF